MHAEINRMEAQIERLTALIKQLRQREDEITAEMLRCSPMQRLKSARKSLDRAKVARGVSARNGARLARRCHHPGKLPPGPASGPFHGRLSL